MLFVHLAKYFIFKSMLKFRFIYHTLKLFFGSKISDIGVNKIHEKTKKMVYMTKNQFS